MYSAKRNFRAWELLVPLIVLLIFLLGIISGCSEDDNPANGTPGANEVLIQGNAFAPGTRTVAVGTTIKWKNNDNAAHTVTSGSPGSPSGTFDSGSLGQNAEFSFTFTQAGTFSYFCKLHPNMTGSIVVQ